MKNLIKILALTLATACCFTACGKGGKTEANNVAKRAESRNEALTCQLEGFGFEKVCKRDYK